MDEELNLYDYRNELYNHIRRKVNNAHDAEDILQDVFVKLYSSKDSVKNPDKFKAFMYQVANNTVIDYYRKKKDVPKAAESFEKPVEDENNNSNLNDEITCCLRKMIDELPKAQQEALLLHDIEGLKHKEISSTKDISVSASKMRVKRGKESLKRTLEDCCRFEVDEYGNIIDYELKNDKCTRCDMCKKK